MTAYSVELTPQAAFIRSHDCSMACLRVNAATAEDAAWSAYLLKRSVGWRHNAIHAKVFSGFGVDERFGLDTELALWDSDSRRKAEALGMWAS